MKRTNGEISNTLLQVVAAIVCSQALCAIADEEVPQTSYDDVNRSPSNEFGDRKTYAGRSEFEQAEGAAVAPLAEEDADLDSSSSHYRAYRRAYYGGYGIGYGGYGGYGGGYYRRGYYGGYPYGGGYHHGYGGSYYGGGYPHYGGYYGGYHRRPYYY